MQRISERRIPQSNLEYNAPESQTSARKKMHEASVGTAKKCPSANEKKVKSAR